MYRFAILAALFACVFQLSRGAADEPKDEKAKLKKVVENADVILVGKVTKTGLVAASSFDVGAIDATKILMGDEKLKSALFRFSGRVTPPYAKVGVEGVWVLSKADNKPGWRNVLSFQPLSEEENVKAVIKEYQNRKDKNPMKELTKEDRNAFQKRYDADILPLLKTSCIGCHSYSSGPTGFSKSKLKFGDPKSSFSMLLDKGFLDVNNGNSLLGRIVEKDDKRRMPRSRDKEGGAGKSLTEKEIEILRSFVTDLDKKRK